MPYNCRECGGAHCPDCRVPESHDCDGLRKSDGPWFQGISAGSPKTMSNIEDTKTPRFSGDEETMPTNRRKRAQRPTPGEGDAASEHEPDDRYREASSSEECASCGASLFEHEAAGCPYCGEIYCGDDLAEHRRDCDERDSESVESTKTVEDDHQRKTKERATRTDELEEQWRERFSSPDVNLDGSLAKANYEEDIESIAEEEKGSSHTTGSGIISRILGWISP